MDIHRKSGFTLIEITVVMVIIGLLMAGIFAYLNVQLQQKKIDTTVAGLEENTLRLQGFITKRLMNNRGELIDRAGIVLPQGSQPVYEQRLPCPSNPELNLGEQGFGVETCPPMNAADGSVHNGVRVATNDAGELIFIGAFPLVTVEGLSTSAQDGYRSPFLYAVSASLTDRMTAPMTSSNTAGVITVKVRDSNDAETTYTDKAFVLISTGQNGLSTQSTDLDNENMNGDDVFAAYMLRSENPDNYYDDRVVFDFKAAVSQNENCVPKNMLQQEFTSSGTWTKPDGFSYAVITMTGAAGGASSCAYNSSTYSLEPPDCPTNTGGSGKKVTFVRETTQIAQTEPVTIGQAGSVDRFGGSSQTSYNQSNQPFSMGGYLFYSGTDGSETSFAGVSMSGGKGATVTQAALTDGDDGTIVKGDPSLILNDLQANKTTSTCQPTRRLAGSQKNEEWGKYCNGNDAHDGVVTITSYLCK